MRELNECRGVLPLQGQPELCVLEAWRPRIYTGSDVMGLTSHTPGWPEGGGGRRGTLLYSGGAGNLSIGVGGKGGTLHAVVWISILHNEPDVAWCTVPTIVFLVLLIQSLPNSESILSSFLFFPPVPFSILRTILDSFHTSTPFVLSFSYLFVFLFPSVHKAPLLGFFLVITGQCRAKPRPRHPYWPRCLNADAGLTQLSYGKNADAVFAFYQHSGTTNAPIPDWKNGRRIGDADGIGSDIQLLPPILAPPCLHYTYLCKYLYAHFPSYIVLFSVLYNSFHHFHRIAPYHIVS
jgi:hypothetical protein